MSVAVWRWLVAVLVIANTFALVIYLRGDVRPDPPAPAVPALPAEWPRLVMAAEAPETADDSGSEEECFSIGPLPSLLAQQRAEDRLRLVADRIRTRQTVSERDRGWWVYLAAGSRGRALDLTRQLAESGLEDFFVVTRGDMENVVSVGLFENIDNARARQRQVREAGFNAQMEIRRESTPQFWVDYEVDPELEAPWRFVIEASPNAQHRAIPCFGDGEAFS
ncbi:SPOR domain-containing protein [Wenzhouxiangella limi]|uniref:SPOR domain-containing protein n=1 Tax=Wenzhouxiangella limi TaxID=2707351 RepID=A0A845UXD3_9GAMM|nr:SPOR domain-containing protein [Wenzhouxiangella limi]NDY94892.1 SPOR domain-containing protein [Wenzhouxiangella limi]